MKSLAKRVEDRYQSAAAMRSDIERYLAGRPVARAWSRPAPPTALAPTPDPTATAVGAAVPEEEQRRSRTAPLRAARASSWSR